MKVPTLVALTCREVTELVTDYMSSEVPSEDRARFEQHLYACTWCMTYLSQLRRSVGWTRQLAAEPVTPSPETQQALTELFRRWKDEQQP